ncbi:cytosine permease [Nocardia sp. NBC_00881]|uniref:purine-cytosine permease family protein n=1 Tax=Nocardia sp. NBC_00881 TaxID=2975995 RepID=UPI003868C375|nr:cytosine permease [Nocardia sp. NBC_00881]
MSEAGAADSDSWLRRVGGEVETVGVAPVPDNQRTATPGKLFIVWAMTSGSAITPLIGAILYPYGLWYMIGAIVVSWLIFLIPCGLFSEMGRELPLTALVVARRTYGWSATFLLSALFSFVNIVFFGLNTATGALIIAALCHTSATPWYWIVGGICIVLVLFGFKWLEYFYRYTALLFIVCYAALTVYLATHYSLHVPRQTTPMAWGTAVSAVAGFSILSWTYKTSTISRFCLPAERTAERTWYFLMPSLGIMMPIVIMGVMGAYSQEAIGDWNIAVLGAQITGWGAVAAIGAALAVLHTNAMNLYPSTVDLLVTLNTVRKPRSWEQPVVTVVLGVLGVLLAQAGILTHAEVFVTGAGELLGPFAFVMIVDWLWGLADKRDVDSYFRPAVGFAGRWRIPALACFLAGFMVNFWGKDFLPEGIYHTVPLSLVGSLVAGGAYGAVLGTRRSSSGRRRPGSKVLADRNPEEQQVRRI